MAGWLITIRTGQHEQHWFSLAIMIRVLAQTVLALALLNALEGAFVLSFALALAGATAVEVGFAAWLVRGHWSFAVAASSLAEVRALVRGFDLLNINQRLFIPFLQLIVTALAGPVALGFFNVSARAPILVHDTVSRSLRALLPGVSNICANGTDHRLVSKLLTDAVSEQILLIFPTLMMFVIHGDLIFVVWLGESSPNLTIALTVIAIGVGLNSVTIPHFWALQALNCSRPLARATTARTIATLACAALALALLKDTTGATSQTMRIELVTPAIYGISATVGMVIVAILAHRRLDLIRPCLANLRWGVIAAWCIGFMAFNHQLGALGGDLDPVYRLGAILAANLIVIGPLVFYIGRRKSFVKPDL